MNSIKDSEYLMISDTNDATDIVLLKMIKANAQIEINMDLIFKKNSQINMQNNVIVNNQLNKIQIIKQIEYIRKIEILNVLIIVQNKIIQKNDTKNVMAMQ